MKKAAVILQSIVLVILFIPFSALADPRMETNNNFCHYILETENTDHEVFLAGCNAIITVAEKPAVSASAAGGVACTNLTASGYGTATVTVPAAASPVTPGTTLVFTNADTATPCTMVESNGREYRSTKWVSRVRADRNRAGFVKIVYEVFCEGGEQ
jgi:hypothetical protein